MCLELRIEVRLSTQKNKGTGVVKSQLSLNVYQGAMLAINPKGLFDTL